MSPTGLQSLDWALIAAYGLTTIGLGIFVSRKQDSTDEYFIGSGKINPLFVGVSLFATLLSTISYLSMPGEAAGKGPVFLVSLLGFPVVYFVVAYLLLPVYMQHRVTSAYELLESRLGLGIRLLAATMFLCLRLVWMMLLVYLAAKAMTVMLGVDPSWVPMIVLVTGIVSVIYTSLGGIQAVVVTDFMQTLLLFGGALTVIGSVTYDFHGFGWFPTHWQSTWDVQPVFSFDPKTRLTMVGSILSVCIWFVATTGGDQTSVQRFMSTRDVGAAKCALATQLIVSVIVQITLCLVGLALLGFFLKHQEHLPLGFDINSDADDLFPRYISYHLPVGVSGLVIAAMFAAAMSSIDSGVNSITAVVMSDYLGRFGWQPKSKKHHMAIARALALGIGLTVVLGSSMVKYIEGNITSVTGKTVNLLSTPIFGLFVYAFFLTRTTRLGAWMGTICGVATAAAIAFSGPLVYLLHLKLGIDPIQFGVSVIDVTDPVSGDQWQTAEDPISFQWIGPLALMVNLAVGIGVSFIHRTIVAKRW